MFRGRERKIKTGNVTGNIFPSELLIFHRMWVIVSIIQRQWRSVCRIEVNSGCKVMLITVKKKLFPKTSWALSSMAEAKMEWPSTGCGYVLYY